MEDNFQLFDCEDGDIVIDFDGHILKVSQLDQAISKVILDNDGLKQLNEKLDKINSRTLPSTKNKKDWIEQGVDCKVLKPGKNWESGKFRVKFTLEFCPDEPEIKETAQIQEPESPLDDLRRQIKDISS